MSTTELDMTEIDELANTLAQLDEEIVAATVIEVEGDSDNDFMSRMDVDDILGGAFLLKGDQTARTFVKGKEVFRNPEVILAERAARERNRDKLRKRIARQRAKRTAMDVEREAKPIDHARMSVALQLLGNLSGVIADLTMQRYNRFRRTLGDVLAEDIAQDAVISIAEAMSKSDTSMTEYAAAVLWLMSAPQPYNTADGPEGAGRLLGTIIRVIGTTIVATYRKSTIKTWVLTVGDEGKDTWVQKDTTVESLDKLATVAHNTHGDIDSLIAKHKASGKPKQKSTPPGMRDKRLFARAVIDCAIEARGLGWLATMMLDDERRRTDGSFKWTENAATIWAGFGFPAMTCDSPRLEADYARKAVKLAFAFLPGIVSEVYELIDSPELMWHVDATCANDMAFVASKIIAGRNIEGANPMDGGVSLEMTMRLMEDPEYRRKSLACIIVAEYDDVESD
jgi:hypothetical protein